MHLNLLQLIGDGIFIAKYPGELGNSLKVSYCTTVDSDNGGTLHSITGLIKVSSTRNFQKTSDYVSKLGGKNDEIHVVVVDEDGEITGTAGEVLETFPFLSVASNAKRSDGTSNYWKDVLKLQSDWIYYGKFHRSSSDSDNSDLCGKQTGIQLTATGNEDFKADHGGKSGNRDGSRYI